MKKGNTWAAEERLHRWLVRLLPADFRRLFASQIGQTFRDLRREAGEQGRRAVVRLWLLELVDLLATGLQQWRREIYGWFRRPQRGAEGERNTMFDSINQDVRYSLRTMIRQPLFTLIVVVTLALGVGANSAIFSVVNATLLTPLPYPGSDRIVTVWEDFSAQGGPEQEWIEVPNFFEWKAQSSSFETLSAFTIGPLNLLLGDEPVTLTGGMVSRDFFRGFAIEPVLGREFSAEEDAPGGSPVALVSYDFWQEKLGGDPQVLGTSLNINDVQTTVVGVLPRNFRTTLATQVAIWQPVRISPTSSSRGNFFLQAMGRIKEGVSLQQVREEMNGIMARIGEQFPENAGVKVQLIPLLELIMQPVAASLWALLAAVTLVLLIACANVANLVLSRSVSRRRELAVRAAVGAGRGRLMRQLLTECLILSLVGGGLGLLLGKLGCDLLVASIPADVPRLDEVGLDANVFLFTLVVSLISALIVGLAPALQNSAADLSIPLNSGGRESRGVAGNRLRSTLVVAEVALVLTLLVGSGLLLRSFSRLQQVDPGFQSAGLVSSELILPSGRFPKVENLRNFMGELAARLAARPGIDSVTGVSVLPLAGGDSDTSFAIEGRPEPTRPQDEPVVWYRRVLPAYFSTMGIPVLRGRDFQTSDHADAPPVVVISDVTAQRFWPGEEVIGKRVRFGPPGQAWNTIVGVVPGVRYRALNQNPRPELYFPYAQRPGRGMNLIVKSSLPTSGVSDLIRSSIREGDPGLPMGTVSRLEDVVSDSIGQQRFVLGLSGVFAVLALLLATVGIYGVISYLVSQRTYEMGLRLALGAPRSRVLQIILNQGLLLTLLGVALGLILSLWLTHFMQSLLFEVSATDPLTFILTAGFLIVVALIASLVPAYRATRIDPLQALRCD